MVQRDTADGADKHCRWCREALLMVQRDTADGADRHC